MSFPSVPSVEEVSKWKQAQVLTYLQSKKDELDLDDKHIKVIEDQEIAGCTFLDLSQEEFERCGLTVGPAKTIMRLIKAIKSQPEGKYHDCIHLYQHIYCLLTALFLFDVRAFTYHFIIIIIIFYISLATIVFCRYVFIIYTFSYCNFHYHDIERSLTFVAFHYQLFHKVDTKKAYSTC